MAMAANLQTRSMYGPNLLMLMGGLFFLVMQQYSVRGVERLVVTSPARSLRIVELERRLARNPSDVTSALDLGRLYGRAGEFPWAYDALRQAERRGSRDPRWRMKLALVYLEVGRNGDGERVLDQARSACDKTECSAHTRLWLQLAGRLAQLLQERGIDAREHPERAEAVLREVLKPVTPLPRAPSGGSREGDPVPRGAGNGSASPDASPRQSPQSPASPASPESPESPESPASPESPD